MRLTAHRRRLAVALSLFTLLASFSLVSLSGIPAASATTANPTCQTTTDYDGAKITGCMTASSTGLTASWTEPAGSLGMNTDVVINGPDTSINQQNLTFDGCCTYSKFYPLAPGEYTGWILVDNGEMESLAQQEDHFDLVVDGSAPSSPSVTGPTSNSALANLAFRIRGIPGKGWELVDNSIGTATKIYFGGKYQGPHGLVIGKAFRLGATGPIVVPTSSGHVDTLSGAGKVIGVYYGAAA